MAVIVVGEGEALKLAQGLATLKVVVTDVKAVMTGKNKGQPVATGRVLGFEGGEEFKAIKPNPFSGFSAFGAAARLRPGDCLEIQALVQVRQMEDGQRSVRIMAVMSSRGITIKAGDVDGVQVKGEAYTWSRPAENTQSPANNTGD